MGPAGRSPACNDLFSPWKNITKASELNARLCPMMRLGASVLAPLVLLEEAAPRRLALPALEDLAILARPAVVVVIQLAAEDEHVHEGGVEEELLKALHRAEPHHVADLARRVVADGKPPALVRDVRADDLDVARVSDTQTVVVRDLDVLEAHRIEAHHLRRNGVDGDLIDARQHVVFDHREHGARTGPVAARRPVHACEEAAVDLLLDLPKVYEWAFNPAVRVVALGVVMNDEG